MRCAGPPVYQSAESSLSRLSSVDGGAVERNAHVPNPVGINSNSRKFQFSGPFWKIYFSRKEIFRFHAKYLISHFLCLDFLNSSAENELCCMSLQL